MKRKSLRGLIALATLLVVSILLTQLLFLRRVSAFEEQRTNQAIKTALLRVRRRIIDTPVLADSAGVSQLSSQYFVVKIDKPVKADFLGQQLKAQLKQVQIDDDFQFAIFDKARQKLVFGQYVTNRGIAPKAQSLTGLPKFAYRNYYFCIYFPLKQEMVLRELNVWILFSSLLGVSVLLFGYALFIILRQRQLADIQTDFINSMTHEFQTPIATISISAEALKTPGMLLSQARIDHYATIVQQEAKRLASQVETILLVARADQPRLQLNKQPILLQDCLMASIRKVQLATRVDPASLRLTGLPTPIYLCVDSIHFSNAIYNLLDNAIKYSVDEVDVVVSLQADDTSVRIAVSDKGIGISKKEAKRIFRKFYRIPLSESNLRTGYGIGLHYVQRIVRAHQGRIYVASKLGAGTTFTICFPKNVFL